MSFPHHFPSLVDDDRQVVLIAGAGLSTPNVPALKELKPKLDSIAEHLGLDPSDDFYELAQRVLDQLRTDGSTDSEARLDLAEKLGILDDLGWFGEAGLPLRGNTPRHRAIARMAVEERLRAVVCLNWDGLLEKGLESVGLASSTSAGRPWRMTSHARAVRNADMPALAARSAFPVIKPHGCVRDLRAAREQRRASQPFPEVVFKLTSQDLDRLTAAQNLIDGRVSTYLAECPLLAVTWRASEEYLRTNVLATAQQVGRAEEDRFTLASRTWYGEHDAIAEAYGVGRDQSFAHVGGGEAPSMDCMFQWLQARFALSKLIGAASDSLRGELQQLKDDLAEPVDSPLFHWADTWLPAWVRTCWRMGVMRGSDPATGRMIESWDIPVSPRDVHVPLGGMTVERKDLASAARLLLAIRPGIANFDYEMFPGGIYEPTKKLLYLPVPGWRTGVHVHDLMALKPLLDEMEKMGFVEALRLIWVDASDQAGSEGQKREITALVSAQMKSSRFAKSGAIAWAELGDLVGGAE